MATAMCPACRVLRNMRTTVVVRTVVGKDGKKRQIRTESHHCETCGMFVSSADREDTALRTAERS